VIIFGLFVLFVLIQSFHANFINAGLGTLPAALSLPADKRKKVSVIICARNEAANLAKNLPSVLAQQYTSPDGSSLIEVVVVDDGSEDDTLKVLAALQAIHPQLRYFSADQQGSIRGKKNALMQGVAFAGSDWLLLTDADCMPAGDQWLQLMVAPLAHGREIVAGYGGYYKLPGLLNAFIRWETLHTWMLYTAYAVGGRPYMAVGRNMACLKTTLQKAMQDPLWTVLPSGDDDLFVSIAGTAANTTVVTAAAAFTHSPAKPNWHQWAHQKKRHLSTGKYYKKQIKVSLGIYAGTHAGMWLLFFAALFTSFALPAIALMSARSLIQWGMWWVSARRLGEARLVYFFPLFDFGWMMYNFAFLPYITWKNKINWK
jgi:glycosyltransferase involved in cell wall biosynthesis